MVKVLLASSAALILLGTLVLVLPFSYTYEFPPGCCPSGAVWGGEPGTEPPPAPMLVGTPVDCGPPIWGGPEQIWVYSFYGFSEPCAEPIHTRRIVGAGLLVGGIFALAAAAVLGRRSELASADSSLEHEDVSTR